MKTHTYLALLLAMVSESAEPVANQYVVVAHPQVETKRLERRELGAIYLGVKVYWDGDQRISPAILEDDSPVTKAFLEDVLHLDSGRFHMRWKQRTYSGGGAPPRVFRSSQELREFVEKTPGAIGIVDAAGENTGLRVVQVVN